MSQLPYDSTFGHLGRVQRAYGTDDPDVIAAIKVMMRQLRKSGNDELIIGIRDGKLTLLQVYAKWAKQDVRTVRVTGILPFDPTAFNWLKGYDGISESTRAHYKDAFNQLLKIKPSFTLEELPGIFTTYRKICVKKTTAEKFKKTKTALQAFVRNYFDQFDPLYLAITKVRTIESKVKTRGHPWTIPEVRAVMKKMKPEHAAQLWTLCLTGAGMTELEAGLSIEGKGIRIKGEKMSRIDDRRYRLVPLVEDPAPMVVKQKRFRGHIKKASKDKMQISDARKCFDSWSAQAGIDFDRRQMYLGHVPQTMTERYGRDKHEDRLVEDANKLKAFIDSKKGIEINPLAEEYVTFTY